MIGFNDKQVLAIELMARKEYDNRTVEEVAAQVGCTKKTLYNWMNNERFKSAVAKRSMELITDLAPMLYKTTAELLQSKDQRCQAKGVDVFLKATERAEQLRKEEEKKEPEIDIDKFIEELDIFPSLKKCKYKHMKYYEQCRNKALDRLSVEFINLMESIKAIELLRGGMDENDVSLYVENRFYKELSNYNTEIKEEMAAEIRDMAEVKRKSLNLLYRKLDITVPKTEEKN